MEKGSFCEHVRHKTKHLAKGEAGEQTGPTGSGSHSAVPGPAFYASHLIPFEFAIKSKKKTSHTLAAFLGPLLSKAEFQDSD